MAVVSLRTSKPILCQSKLFCVSILYLFTSVFLALYASLSNSKCLFRSSPFDPIQYSLFRYPSTYGEHKYSLPTHRSSCDSPVYFSDYPIVIKKVEELCRNSTALGSGTLQYMQGDSESFGGNFSIKKRFSYFDHDDDEKEIPCGFFKRLPISSQDQVLMENCDRVVVVSAIFGDHDKIRQPKGLGAKTLDSVCFFMFVDDHTLQRLDYHNLISIKSREHWVGVWRIVKVSSEELYDNAAMNGVIFKHLIHRLFPKSKYSIWIDAKLQLVVDPLLLIHSLIVKEDVDMAISKHPMFVNVMEEAMATARWKKWWDVKGLKNQIETYCDYGLKPWSSHKPYPSDVPDTALILRKHSLVTKLFSCLLFNELEGFNPRDQLAFAFVRDHMTPQLKMNMFDVEVFEQVALEYRHNLKKGGGSSNFTSNKPKINMASFDPFANSNCTKCEVYLSRMWGESRKS